MSGDAPERRREIASCTSGDVGPEPLRELGEEVSWWQALEVLLEQARDQIGDRSEAPLAPPLPSKELGRQAGCRPEVCMLGAPGGKRLRRRGDEQAVGRR